MNTYMSDERKIIAGRVFETSRYTSPMATPWVPPGTEPGRYVWAGYREKLTEAKRWLRERGSVSWREDRSRFIVRFREHHADGTTTRRSISIGDDPAVAQKARELIYSWRQEAREEDTDERLRQVLYQAIERADLGENQQLRLKRYACEFIARSRNGRPPEGARWGSIEKEARMEICRIEPLTGRLVAIRYEGHEARIVSRGHTVPNRVWKSAHYPKPLVLAGRGDKGVRPVSYPLEMLGRKPHDEDRAAAARCAKALGEDRARRPAAEQRTSYPGPPDEPLRAGEGRRDPRDWRRAKESAADLDEIGTRIERRFVDRIFGAGGDHARVGVLKARWRRLYPLLKAGLHEPQPAKAAESGEEADALVDMVLGQMRASALRHLAREADPLAAA
jgi:hypothetical protein